MCFVDKRTVASRCDYSYELRKHTIIGKTRIYCDLHHIQGNVVFVQVADREYSLQPYIGSVHAVIGCEHERGMRILKERRNFVYCGGPQLSATFFLI
jgi:hypothetical protein